VVSPSDEVSTYLQSKLDEHLKASGGDCAIDLTLTSWVTIGAVDNVYMFDLRLGERSRG
jgi:hypothetical protein